MLNHPKPVQAFQAMDGSLHLNEKDALLHTIALQSTNGINELASRMFGNVDEVNSVTAIRSYRELALLLAKSLKDPKQREVWQMLIDLHNEGHIA